MIEAVNLTKKFDNVTAVDNISFKVDDGDIFGFIGPNGAGKTTTIKMLATLLDPTTGTAFIDDKCIVNDTHDVRKTIGYMPDYYGVYEGVSVREYLDFFGEIYHSDRKLRRRTIDDAIALTDLTKVEDKLVSTLSKGMKQRLCLGRTLIHDPKVLIMDEPAAGLDPRARIELRYLLKELKNLGKTILLSSHILTELEDVCDSIGIIEKGRLVACGNLAEIKGRMSKGAVYAVTVLEDPSNCGDVLGRLETVLSFEIDSDKKVVVARMKDAATPANELVRALMDNGLSVVQITRQEENLEDIFMRMTEGEVS